MPRTELSFYAVDGVDVQPPDAVRVARRRVIGRTYNNNTKTLDTMSEPDVVVLAGDHAHADADFLRRACKRGELKAADQATADFLEVPLVLPAKAVKSLPFSHASTPSRDGDS